MIFDYLRNKFHRANSFDQNAMDLNTYHLLLNLLLSQKETLNVVIIGANDGVTSDPKYNFLHRNASRTRLVLIEPQKAVIPYLRANFQFHNDIYIFEGAIGSKNTLSLYTVKQEFWKKISPAYARGWPHFRAATGISSTEYENVINWIKRYYHGPCSPSDMVEELVVPCSELMTVVRMSGLFALPDVIQIDTEGFDDEIIYSSSISLINPALILFETDLLSLKRRKRVFQYLVERGYYVSQLRRDAIAVRTSR